MKHIHSKLVYDNIPAIIFADHKTVKIRTLNNDLIDHITHSIEIMSEIYKT